MISVCHNLFVVLLVSIAAFGDQQNTISIIENKEFQGLENMSTERLVACEFEVFGRVQGVFFRKFTASQANSLGVKGWVMNTASGSVKGQLEGSEDKVNAMKKWLEFTGSPSSTIERASFTQTHPIQKYSFQSFTIKK